MAYDRYERSRSPRARNDRNDFDRDSRRGNMRGSRYDADDRDMFDRAGDEVRSWFGDDEAERRREMDERRGYSGDGYKNQHFGFENIRDRTEGYSRSYDDDSRYSNRDSYGRREPRDFDRNEMRDFDDNRSMSRRRQGRPMGRMDDRDREDMYDYERGYGEGRMNRGQTQREFTRGERSGRDTEYGRLRNRHIEELDNDYRQWSRENQERFEDEFTSWRERRSTMRTQLKQLDDNATIMGSDGEQIGTVEKVRGDRIIVRSSDDENRRSMFNMQNLDSVESNQVRLNMTAENARQRMKMNQRDDDDSELVLDRSQSVEY